MGQSRDYKSYEKCTEIVQERRIRQITDLERCRFSKRTRKLGAPYLRIPPPRYPIYVVNHEIVRHPQTSIRQIPDGSAFITLRYI